MRKLIILFVLLSSQGLSAQSAPNTAPCQTEEYRQFDFWAGHWQVTAPNGNIVGSNTIEVILGGCALQENWVSAGANRGYSYNIYDRTRDKWQQTWVDNSGSLLLLSGRFVAGEMVLTGSTINEADKSETLQKITWTPNEDGTVRQHWQTSSDDGKTWSTAFDGLYKKLPEAAMRD